MMALTYNLNTEVFSLVSKSIGMFCLLIVGVLFANFVLFPAIVEVATILAQGLFVVLLTLSPLLIIQYQKGF